jgi:hypothetical protein
MPSERNNGDPVQGPAPMYDLSNRHFYNRYNRTAIAWIALKKGKVRAVPIQRAT